MALAVVRPARPSEALALTQLAHASKQHWGYPEEWIRLWREDLTFTAEFIAEHPVWVAELEGALAGVCALAPTPLGFEVEHLWVDPGQMGRGIGRLLFERALKHAHELGARELEIVADPNAEPFYLRMGARRAGQVASRPEGRILPRLLLPL